MKFLSKLLLFITFFSLLGYPQANKNNIHASEVYFTNSAGFFCTGYAIGRHSMATAKHCLNGLILINNIPLGISKTIDDGNDHVILITNHLFENFVSLNIVKPKQGDKVFYFGNPGGFKDMYREGYMAGVDTDTDGKLNMFFDVRSGPGDSGSLVFNEQGDVVAMASRNSGPMLASFFFNFKPEQLKEIQ